MEVHQVCIYRGEDAAVHELAYVCIHHNMCWVIHCGGAWLLLFLSFLLLKREWRVKCTKKPDHQHTHSNLLKPVMLYDGAKAKVKALKDKNKLKTWSKQLNIVLRSGSLKRRFECFDVSFQAHVKDKQRLNNWPKCEPFHLYDMIKNVDHLKVCLLAS